MTITLTRARQTTTTSGTTSPFQLDGAAPTGYRSFVAAAISEQGGSGPWSDVYYVATDGGSNWEHGRGVLTDAATDTITRGSVLLSSNSDAIVNFPAGTKTIYSWPPGNAMTALSNRVRAQLSGNQSVGSQVWTTIQYAQEDQDQAGDYNNSTYTWTAPSDGWYTLYWYAQCNAAEVISLRYTYSGSNNVLVDAVSQTGVGAHFIRYITSGVTINFQIYTTTASTILDESRTILNIARIGD